MELRPRHASTRKVAAARKPGSSPEICAPDVLLFGRVVQLTTVHPHPATALIGFGVPWAIPVVATVGGLGSAFSLSVPSILFVSAVAGLAILSRSLMIRVKVNSETVEISNMLSKKTFSTAEAKCWQIVDLHVAGANTIALASGLVLRDGRIVKAAATFRIREERAAKLCEYLNQLLATQR